MVQMTLLGRIPSADQAFLLQVAVQASRIATFLHKTEKRLGQLQDERLRNLSALVSPKSCFVTSNHARMARLLLALVVPGHLAFTCLIAVLSQGKLVVQPHTYYESAGRSFLPVSGSQGVGSMFLVCYLCSSLLQVSLLLCMANLLVHLLWSHSIDPDNAAIPYLTALGDLLGGALLAATFWMTT